MTKPEGFNQVTKGKVFGQREEKHTGSLSLGCARHSSFPSGDSGPSLRWDTFRGARPILDQLVRQGTRGERASLTPLRPSPERRQRRA
eukprot:scaffold71053_cov63-Phaeocystis_antarctica.AAC.1